MENLGNRIALITSAGQGIVDINPENMQTVNSGIASFQAIAGIARKEADKIIKVNVQGVLWGIQAAAKKIKQRQHKGKIKGASYIAGHFFGLFILITALNLVAVTRCNGQLNNSGITIQSHNSVIKNALNFSADTAIAAVTIDPARPGAPIPSGFLGFSHEWGQAQMMLGDPAIGTNQIYRQLLKNLLAYGGGPLSIRIGGSTTDRTGEPRANTVTPLARLYQDFKGTTPGTSFILGVNMGSNDVDLTTRQAKAFVNGMPVGSIRLLKWATSPTFRFQQVPS